MATIKAVSLSTAASRVIHAGSQGYVHSVFRRVLNLLCDEFLITLADSRIGELPNGLLLALEGSDRLDQLGVRPKMALEIADRRLFIPEARLGIDLSDARLYPSQRVIDAALLPTEVWLERLAEAQLVGASLAPQEGFGPLWKVVPSLTSRNGNQELDLPPLLRTAWEPTRSLLKGVRTLELALVAKSVSALSGLGIGLTPSGDDLLTGFLAAIVLVSEKVRRPHSESQSLVALITEAASGRTNQIAYQYLRQASQGEVSASLAEYIAAIVSELEADIENRTRQLFSYGATSGSELALGAYLGIVSLLNNQA